MWREQRIAEATARLTGKTTDSSSSNITNTSSGTNGTPGGGDEEEEVWAAEEDPDDFVYEADPVDLTGSDFGGGCAPSSSAARDAAPPRGERRGWRAGPFR